MKTLPTLRDFTRLLGLIMIMTVASVSPCDAQTPASSAEIDLHPTTVTRTLTIFGVLAQTDGIDKEPIQFDCWIGAKNDGEFGQLRSQAFASKEDAEYWRTTNRIELETQGTSPEILNDLVQLAQRHKVARARVCGTYHKASNLVNLPSIGKITAIVVVEQE